VGYFNHTLSSQEFTSANVDISGTKASGFQWYHHNTADTGDITLNADGTATLTGSGEAQFESIASQSTSPYYVGTAYGCGGYFEAEIAFDPTRIKSGYGYPAWWAMSVEHVALRTTAQQWSGAATGYAHYAELDFMEVIGSPAPSKPRYFTTVWDYSGINGTTCTGWCTIGSANSNTTYVPPYTDFNLYHRVAALWVPATASANGYFKFYFDDILVNSGVSWTQFTTQAPPATASSSWLYGIVDQQHLVLMLGTGKDNSDKTGTGPMTVRSINVWQGSGACNITY
jgi:hypothetical protein